MAQNKSGVDIFGLLSDKTGKSEKEKNREALLAPTGVKEVFKEGKISINNYTCVGVQCKQCVKVCPTNALYWSNGKVEIIDDLCVYCGACVLSCMVDDCIKVERKREDGTTEKFGKPQDVILLQKTANASKRVQRLQSVVLKPKDYYTQYPKAKPKQASRI
jgi:ferredoxin